MQTQNLTRGCTTHRRLIHLVGVAVEDPYRLVELIGPDEVHDAEMAADMARHEARCFERLGRHQRRAIARLTGRIATLRRFAEYRKRMMERAAPLAQPPADQLPLFQETEMAAAPLPVNGEAALQN